LSQIERGEIALDSISDIVALANALQIAPSELIRLPVPAPANGETDSAVEAVRGALMAVGRDRPGGQVVPLDALRARVAATLAAHYSCRQDGEVGAALPGLIRDLHTSIAAGRDVAELLDLAVLLHAGATPGWLRVAGASLDLRGQACQLAYQAAQHRDTPTALGLATWGGLHVMLAQGEFDLAQAELDAVTVPTNTPESMQLAGMLSLSRSLVASADFRPGDIDAPLELAGELAERTGEGNAYWMGFGPTNAGFWRMNVALEAGDHQRAATIAKDLHPEAHPFRGCQAMYWVHYGRALARLRGRQDDAVRAFRQAERISPRRVHRNPLVREVLGGLLTRTRRDSPAGRELRRMAYRAGLPV
ncbi:MAG TPA: XRE family transcriptional regulator, partial [Pseudonocardiaceae bacterium]|nr:XRE family transcriptional regulator [Pseudonocardiaceae bacterium]